MILAIVMTWVIAAFVAVVGVIVASEQIERMWSLSRRAIVGLCTCAAIAGPLLAPVLLGWALYHATRYIGGGVAEAKRNLLPGKKKPAALPEAKVRQ